MLKQAGPKGKASAVRLARQVRREMTPPEFALSSVLKVRPEGLKFRRQHPLGERLALDFFCNDARLAIEVDGEAHDRGDQPERDRRRDFVLQRFGIEMLRLPAAYVLGNLDGAVAAVLDRARERLPLHHPARPGGPPPRGKLGEDKEER